MKLNNKCGFSRAEACVLAVLVAGLGMCAMAVAARTKPTAEELEQVKKLQKIVTGCNRFAADNGGAFPNGNYDPELGRMEWDRDPAESAEGCFTDLLKSKHVEAEKSFWNPNQTIQCSREEPNENKNLAAKENCWDYISGLSVAMPPSTPIMFEASDGGAGTTWSKAGGHPWEGHVAIGLVDGSMKGINFDADGQLKFERKGKVIHFCLPIPGENNWPEKAKIAPATPAPRR